MFPSGLDDCQAYSKCSQRLTFGPVGAQEVLLEVKFAEVDRSALLSWGSTLFAPGLEHHRKPAKPTVRLGHDQPFCSR